MAWSNILIMFLLLSTPTGLGSGVTIEHLHEEVHGVKSFNEIYTNDIRADVNSCLETIRNVTVGQLNCNVSGIENQFQIAGAHVPDKAFELTALDTKLMQLHKDIIVSLPNSLDKAQTVDCSDLNSRNKDRLTFDDINMFISKLRESVDNMAYVYGVVVDRLIDQLNLMEAKRQKLVLQQKYMHYLHELLLTSVKTLVHNERVKDRRLQQLNRLERKILKQRYPDRFHTIRGQSYFIETNRNVTWDEALNDCESYGGYLAEINTTKERKALKRLFETKMRGMEIYIVSLWVGMKNNRKDWSEPWVWYHSQQLEDGRVFKKMTRKYIVREWECVTVHNQGYAIVLEIEDCEFHHNNYICEFD